MHRKKGQSWNGREVFIIINAVKIVRYGWLGGK